MVFAHGDKRVHNTAVDQAKITGVAWNGDRGQASDEPVKSRGSQQLEARLAFTGSALSVDHFRALFPAQNQLRDDLRRILKVGIHDNDGLAARIVKPG